MPADPNPLSNDNLNVQLPGRLLACELLITLLLREKSHIRRILVEADAQLSRLEAHEAAHSGGQPSDYAGAVFATARQQLDVFATWSRKG